MRFSLINSLKDKRENVSEGFDNILIEYYLRKEITFQKREMVTDAREKRGP